MKKYFIYILIFTIIAVITLSACNLEKTSTEPENSESVFTTEPGGPSPTQGQSPSQSELPPTTDGNYSTTAPQVTKKPTTGGSTTATKKPEVTQTPSVTVKPTPKPYDLPYVLYVNRKQNIVTVYTYDEAGKYTKPVKAMVCSTGSDNGTPTGSFEITDKYTWRLLFGDVYGQYACRITGHILFHSVPYLEKDKSTLLAGEYNKLGEQASDGCIRLCVADVKWIYDNCASGTKVVIYDGDGEEPLGKPEIPSIPVSSQWDPTDPDAENPWLKQLPLFIRGTQDKSFQRNSPVDLLQGVYVTDAYGNRVTYDISIEGSVNTSKTGIYKVEYSVTHESRRVFRSSVYVNIFDETAPIINGLEDNHVYDKGDIQKITREKLLEGVWVTDDGDRLDIGAVKLTLNGKEYSPDMLEPGINTIIAEVSDESGNTASQEITVFINETETFPPEQTPSQTPETTPEITPEATPEITTEISPGYTL